MRGQAGVDGFRVMRILDVRERGQAERKRAGAQEGIGHEITLSCDARVLNGLPGLLWGSAP
jgi:hypothetical protein